MTSATREISGETPLALRLGPRQLTYLISLGSLFAALLAVEYELFRPQTMLSSAYILAVISLSTSWLRGGIHTLLFWVVLFAVYPLLTPFIVVDLLGFPLFSAWAIVLQQPATIAAPIFVAAAGCLFMAINISNEEISSQAHLKFAANISQTAKEYYDYTPWLLILSLGALGMCGFAWLTEPGPPVGFADYSGITDARFGETRFAGGGWALCAVLSYAAELKCRQHPQAKYRRLGRIIFLIAFVFSLLWLISHARRSEITGFLLLVLLIDGRSIKPALKYAGGAILGILLIAVAYLRQFLSPVEAAAADWFQLPGAPGNVLLSYIGAFHFEDALRFDLDAGTTYLRYLQNLPPEFMGLERIPTPYDFVDRLIPLIGGEYIFMEPFLNFGIWGIPGFLVIFVFLHNLTIRTGQKFMAGEVNLTSFLFAGAFIVMILRTYWYGGGAVYRVAVMALLLVPLISILNSLAHRYVRNLGQR